MSRITSTPEEKSSKLRSIYDEVRQTLHFKEIPQVLKVQSVDPEIPEANWIHFKTIMLRESSITRDLKELIAVAVSKTNSCQYGIDAHNAFLKSLGYEDKEINDLNQYLDSDKVSKKERAVLNFATKVSENSHKITNVDRVP